MGTDKALLLFEGVPLVVRVARALAEGAGEVVVVTRRPEDLVGLGLEVVADDPGPQTPLTGIATALRHAGGRPVFVAACDMPYVSPEFVRALLALAPLCDAVVPVRDGRPEPLHAVWSPSALLPIEAALEEGHMAPREVLEDLTVRWVTEDVWRQWDPAGLSFANLNTPSDMDRERPSS
jgi:molybdopterin-guanine dinucleotide biosynthesis protein A